MASGSRFDSLLNQVQNRLDVLESSKDQYPNVDLDRQKTLVSHGLRDLNQCQGNITEMERLIQTMPMRDREFFKQDIDSCRESHKQLLAEFNKMDEEVKRNVLLAKKNRDQGLDMDLVARTGQKLDATNSNLDKAINIGGNVVNGLNKAQGTLASDREALGRIDANVDNVIAETQKANGIANGLKFRQFINSFISYIVAGILFCLIILFAWAKFASSGFMYRKR